LGRDLGVDREFQRRLDVAAVDRLAVEIDHDDILDREAGALRSAGVDVERAGVAAHTAMAVVVDVFRVLQHADGVHQLLLDLVLRRLWHSAVSCLSTVMAGHSRPKDALLRSPMFRPSTSSFLKARRGCPARGRA